MKIKTSKKKNLFRVDAHLNYLVYTDKDTYDESDFCQWLKTDFHSGELDEKSTLEVKKVESTKQIQEFLEKDYDYNVYYTDSEDADVSIHTLVKELNLDIDNIIIKLRKLGYTVTKPKVK
jgi:hypothetical protein